jgi:hypothetical protein
MALSVRGSLDACVLVDKRTNRSDYRLKPSDIQSEYSHRGANGMVVLRSRSVSIPLSNCTSNKFGVL